MTVFFSFLSTLILVALYFLFIAKLYTGTMDNPQMGGISVTIADGAKYFVVYLQMMAGVLVLNSISLATGSFSIIAKDFEDRRVDSFLITPVETYEIILAYYAAGLIASFCFNIFTWVLSFGIIGVFTGYWLAIGPFFMVFAVLFMASLISCSLMFFITSLVKSSAAIGVISGVSGTVFGFLCGIYMPYSNLGESTKAIGSLFPFTHIVIWLKQVVLGNAFSQLGITGDFKNILFREYFSAESIGFLNIDLPLWTMVVLSGILGFMCLTASYIIMNRRLISMTSTKGGNNGR
jgi:multidrug/hemolysin transport system permease protein